MKLGFFILPFLALTACSSDPSPGNPTPTNDAAVPEDSGKDDPKPDGGKDDPKTDGGKEAAPQVCSTLANGGTDVDAIGKAEDPPALNGGTIADGTYFLTAFDVYTGPGGQTGPAGLKLKSTIRIAGSTLEQISSSGAADTVMKDTFTTSGSTLSRTLVCSDATRADNGKYNYEATGTTLILQGQQFPKLVFRFTKQ